METTENAFEMQSPLCMKCQLPIVTGHAYELGEEKWHIECFKCHKCEKPLDCDSNFLVLGTGALICFDCSDSCKSCGKKIDDLAIILSNSNEAYCSNCFRCYKCGDRIEDLKYAKTRKGLFCLRCHSRLLEKRKLHEERKRKKLLNKDLPEIIPNSTSMLNSIDSTSIEIPLKSKERLLSPPRNERRQRYSISSADSKARADIKSDANNVTSQYLNDDSRVNHSRNESLNDILDSTLQNDEDEELKQDDDSSSSHNTRDISTGRNTFNDHIVGPDGEPIVSMIKSNEADIPDMSQGEFLSPLRSAKYPQMSKSPKSYRRGIVMSDIGYSDEDNINIGLDDAVSRLGISLSKSPKPDAEPSVDPLSLRLSPDSFDSTGFGIISNSNNSSMVANTLQLAPALSPVLPSINKTPSILDFSQLSPEDTHSGWGTSAKQSLLQRRVTSRGRSDSTIYFNKSQEKDPVIKAPSRTPTKFQSNGVFRTPPIDNGYIHGNTNLSADDGHRKTLSWQSKFRQEEGGLGIRSRSKGSLTEPSLNKEMSMKEATVMKLTDDIENLQTQKTQLLYEVDELNTSKQLLNDELVALKDAKVKYAHQLESYKIQLKRVRGNNNNQISTKASSAQDEEEFKILPENLWEDAVSPIRYATTATVKVAKYGTRPRFWKRLAGTHSKDAPSPPLNTEQKLEISGPRLVNPDEFQDVKLVPIPSKAGSNSRSLGKSDITTSSSSPLTAEGISLYSSSLVSRVKFENNPIPLIVKTCIDYIESSDDLLSSEGLYRKSGSQTKIIQLEGGFEKISPQDLDGARKLVEEQDVHLVASVLKRYLRKLPDPVLTYDYYEQFMDLVKDNNLPETLPCYNSNNTEYKSSPMYLHAIGLLQNLLSSIPEPHLNLLRVLCHHVTKVSDYSKINLMTLQNLALVFAPSLITDRNGDKDISDLKERNYLITFIFGNYRDLLR